MWRLTNRNRSLDFKLKTTPASSWLSQSMSFPEKSSTTSVPVRETGKAASEEKLAAASPLNVPVRNTSLVGATFNLTKSAVGAGTIFLPAMLAKLGPVVGSIYLIAGGILTALPLYFLGRMAHHCETGDYFKLGRLALGKKGETFVSVSLLLFLAGGLVAYAYFTGNLLQSFLTTVGASARLGSLSSERNMTVFAAIFIFMLSTLRDMNQLAKTSIFAMICMLGIATLLVYDACFPLNDFKPFAPAETATGAAYARELVELIGKVIFAYVNHFTIVSLVPVLVDPSAKARTKLIGASSGLAMTIYLMAALGGYMRFGKHAGGSFSDILSVYEDNAPHAYTVARLALALVLICSYPLLLDPARACLDSLAFGPESNLSKGFRHYLETAIIVVVPVTVAYTTGSKSDKVLSLFSGLCGSLLVFTLPGLFYLRLSRSFKFSISKWERVLAYFCIVLGVVLALSSSTFGVLAFF